LTTFDTGYSDCIALK